MADLFHDAHALADKYPDLPPRSAEARIVATETNSVEVLRVSHKARHGFDPVQLAKDVALRLRMFGVMLQLLRDWQTHNIEVKKSFRERRLESREAARISSDNYERLRLRLDTLLAELPER